MLFNEPKLLKCVVLLVNRDTGESFSALQRAEIAEIYGECLFCAYVCKVSVLFNEPKLLKSTNTAIRRLEINRFSALQRAEIAEIDACDAPRKRLATFQCSSTSRNC